MKILKFSGAVFKLRKQVVIPHVNTITLLSKNRILHVKRTENFGFEPGRKIIPLDSSNEYRWAFEFVMNFRIGSNDWL